MTIIVETGAIIANANSYVTLAEARAYSLSRGVTLSATDSAVEILLTKAMDYLEAQRDRYQGCKVSPDQTLQWPRAGVCLDGYDITITTIPAVLKSAQMQLAMDAVSYDLQPNRTPNSKGAIIKERIEGAVERDYAEPVSLTPFYRKAESLLQPLYKAVGGLFVRA